MLTAVAARAERHRVLVTAAPSVDAERLAYALRTYLEGFSIEVLTAPAQAAADLRDQLAATNSAGADVRAIAAIRVDAGAGTVEIQLVDRVSQKSLMTVVARPSRDEDFYRTVALKVQALLRSALFEQVEQLKTSAPELVRLVAPPAPAPTPSAPHRISIEAAYALASFPLGDLVQHGVEVSGRVELRRIFELGIGVQVLAPLRAVREDVSLALMDVPIILRAAVHLRRPRLEGAIGAIGELLVVALDTTSATSSVRSDRSVSPALGVEAAGRVRLASVVWLFVRASVLGVFDAQRYTVRGQPALDLSRLQVGGEAGLGVAVW